MIPGPDYDIGPRLTDILYMFLCILQYTLFSSCSLCFLRKHFPITIEIFHHLNFKRVSHTITSPLITGFIVCALINNAYCNIMYDMFQAQVSGVCFQGHWLSY